MLGLVRLDTGVEGRSTSILGRELERWSWILGIGLKGGRGKESGSTLVVSFSLEFLLTSCDTLSATFSMLYKYFLQLSTSFETLCC